MLQQYKWLLENYEMEHSILRTIKRKCVCRPNARGDNMFIRAETRQWRDKFKNFDDFIDSIDIDI